MVVISSELLKTKNDEKIYIIEEESTPEKKTPTLNNNKRLQALLILTISIPVMMILFLIFKNSHNVDSSAEHLLPEKIVEKPLNSIIEFKITSSTKGFLFPSPKSFYNASSYCEYHGMKLYKINSNYKQNLIFDHTEKMFSSGGGTRIWVNGKWSSDRQKWLSYPDKDLIFPSESYERDEHCLAIQSFRRNVYDIASVLCSATNYFYCES